jgi:hypothetical protein
MAFHPQSGLQRLVADVTSGEGMGNETIPFRDEWQDSFAGEIRGEIGRAVTLVML